MRGLCITRRPHDGASADRPYGEAAGRCAFSAVSIAVAIIIVECA
jgi:hypothetical protein